MTRGKYDKSFVHRVEHERLMHALVLHDGSLAATARSLGIPYRTMQSKIARHGLNKYAAQLRARAKRNRRGGVDAEKKDGGPEAA